MNHPELEGPINFTSGTITNYDMTKTIGRVFWRPTLFWIPEFVFRLASPVMGEFIDGALLSSLQVIPEKLINSGFQFEDQNFEVFLKHQVESRE